MKNVEYQTRQLIREIKRSNVYNQYRRLQMKIVRDVELNRRVDEFRKACFMIQNGPQAPEDMGRLEALRCNRISDSGTGAGIDDESDDRSDL